jgi:hypothetical protein
MGGSAWSSAVLLRPGGAGLGQAWHGLVGLGPDRRGVAWLGAVFGASVFGTWLGEAGLGTAAPGGAGSGKARRGGFIVDILRRGEARHGLAVIGVARLG